MTICEFCRYFTLTDSFTETGKCHRYPPVLVVIGEDVHYNFPVVHIKDYCGEAVPDLGRGEYL